VSLSESFVVVFRRTNLRDRSFVLPDMYNKGFENFKSRYSTSQYMKGIPLRKP